MFTEISEGEARELPIVIKTDVRGSLEAILGGLEKLKSDEVLIRLLHAAVGGVNESDVVLANASSALVIGFNVRADPVARDLARQIGTEIRYYSVIYELLDELKAILSGMLDPEVQEHPVGAAEVLEVFNISKLGRIAGCRITEGTARRNVRARLVRDSIVVHEGAIGSLKRFPGRRPRSKRGQRMRRRARKLPRHSARRCHRVFLKSSTSPDPCRRSASLR